jgi:hypothetical protein
MSGKRPQSDLLLVSDLISASERRQLIEWGLSMKPSLWANGPARAFRKVGELAYRPALYDRVRARVEDRLGVESEYPEEPIFGWYLSIISEGGAIQPHLDPVPDGKRHLRCNLFLQLPESGGAPIIQGTRISVQAGSLLAFFPSERGHRSEPVIGRTERIILSFGYLVPLSYRLPAAGPPAMVNGAPEVGLGLQRALAASSYSKDE